MGKWWFTADDHFNHEAIIGYCNRPFKSVDHMDMELIRRWNERVDPKDSVLHLGDFNFRRHGKSFEYYANQLNGNIILVKGNHDEKNDVKSIITSCIINYGGIDWYCQHEPSNMFKYNLCGHVHENWKIRRRGPYVCVNVGVDVWDFYPIDISEIMKAIQTDDTKGVF